MRDDANRAAASAKERAETVARSMVADAEARAKDLSAQLDDCRSRQRPEDRP